MNTAERIYSASTSEEAKTARLAERLARQIEDEIASSSIPAGDVIGSLRDLSERYSAGRAAAREAVALLERRGLGRLRPGPCGGFVVTRPESHAIAAELANYFRMAGVTPAQLKDAREAVDLMAVGLAAERRPEPWRVAALPRSGCGLDWHLKLQSQIASLTGEPVIELFVHCLNDLTASFAVGAGQRETPRSAHDCRLLRDALVEGDVSAALAEAAELQAKMNGCLEEEGSAELPAIATSRHADDRTLSTFVARRLAAEILKKGKAGQRLGSEWDLSERFSVSRATLRQAIRQLQDSGLVECRRGRGNGLVVRDLAGTGSIRLVLAFLIGRQMDPLAAGTFLFQLNRHVPALAIARADTKQRARIEELLTRVKQQDLIDRYELLRLVQGVSEAADSPIIDLFSRCLAAYEARFHPSLAERLPAKVQAEYFALLERLLRGVDGGFDAAKEESARVLQEMSRSRPL